MKNTLRNEVLEFLRNLPKVKYDQFNKAFELFRKCEPKNYNSERNYNMGFTEQNLKNILYDLQKHYNISNVEILVKATPVVEKTTKEEKYKDNADTNKKGEDNRKMREEFPFLNEKDCPNELKILVADKMTAYKNYCDAHNKLTQNVNREIELTEDEVNELTKTSVENFEENQNIYTELNHYKETKEILGVHPIFNQLKMEREVAGMDNTELHKYIGSSAKFFTTKKQYLANEKDADKIAKINIAVDLRNQKLAMVKKRLNIV